MLEMVIPRIRCVRQEENYGKYVVEPMERGYGTTVGNALRRVLLSSMHGVAVTAVKIEGALHEFATLPGVVEDCTELILNLKNVAIRSQNGVLDTGRTGRITVKGEGEVTGADIQLPALLEVVTPDAHIATLSTKHAQLSVELTLESGVGYVAADRRARQAKPIGTIPIDAIFSPIRRVNYFVEPTRIRQKSDYDRLVVEVWTNGAMDPQQAISEAAKLLSQHLSLFFDFADKAEPEGVGTEMMVRERDKVLAYRIDDLDFSVRTYNCLKRDGKEILGDLIKITEVDLMRIRNFGRKSLTEVVERLGQYGLKLAAPPEDEPFKDADDFGFDTDDDDDALGL